MSAKILHLTPSLAKYDPESQFACPSTLAGDIGLTRGEKIAALERWSYLVDRRLASSNEGMSSNTREDWDADLKRQIELEIASLKGANLYFR